MFRSNFVLYLFSLQKFSNSQFTTLKCFSCNSVQGFQINSYSCLFEINYFFCYLLRKLSEIIVENKSITLFRRYCISGGKKCSFFGKFGVLCFLETPVLRFALLPYYWWFRVTTEWLLIFSTLHSSLQSPFHHTLYEKKLFGGFRTHTFTKALSLTP